MSPTIGRIILGGALDSEVRAWRSAIVANNGGVSNYAVQAVNRFVRGCKSDGSWNLLLDLGVFAGGDNLSAALVKLKTPTGTQRVLTNNNFVSADYQATGTGAGLRANAINKYLSTGLADTAASQNSISIGCYVTAVATTSRYYIGNDFASAFCAIKREDASSSSARFWNSSSTGIDIIANANTQTGILAATRTTSADYFAQAGSMTSTMTRTSSARNGSSFYVFAWNNASAAGEPSDARLTAYWIGAGMTSAQLTAFSARLNTLMQAFGCNTF